MRRYSFRKTPTASSSSTIAIDTRPIAPLPAPLGPLTRWVVACCWHADDLVEVVAQDVIRGPGIYTTPDLIPIVGKVCMQQMQALLEDRDQNQTPELRQNQKMDVVAKRHAELSHERWHSSALQLIDCVTEWRSAEADISRLRQGLREDVLDACVEL